MKSKLFKNIKAGLGVSTIVVILVALILGAVIIFVSTDLFDTGAQSGRDLIKINACTETLDGEGTWSEQKRNDLCPCDADFKTSRDYYGGKVYSVKHNQLKTGGLARGVFNGEFLNGFSEEDPLRISVDDTNLIVKYINEKKSSNDVTLTLSQYLNGFVETKSPPLTVFCSKYVATNPSTCTERIFKEEWYVEDSLSCYTSDDECNNRFAKAAPKCGFEIIEIEE